MEKGGQPLVVDTNKKKEIMSYQGSKYRISCLYQMKDFHIEQWDKR